jgi:DeoR family transcriptional regulator, fructose operon transcriptional repressor
MFIEERLEKIIELLQHQKRLTVEEAADLCQVSVDTIRRDFKKLTERGQVTRTHGGILVKDDFAYDSSTIERQVRNIAVKKAIARKAATFVEYAETIAIDAGTTTFQMIEHLTAHDHLTVLTYGLDIANETIKCPNIATIIAGGMIRRKTASVIGPEALAMIKKMHVSTLFLGANAVNITTGLMTPNSMEAEIKKALIDISDHVILLADSSKINKQALVSFSPLDRVSVFITDTQAAPSFLDDVDKMGVEMVLVEP